MISQETKQARFIESLKNINDWVSVAEWAVRVGEDYPDILADADRDALNQKNDTTGLREIAARLSSRISSGAFRDFIEIDASERPKKVRYSEKEEIEQHESEELEEDVAPLKRNEIIRRDQATLSAKEQYRIDEFEAISKQLKTYFGLEFEVDHASALLNPGNPGKHHPNNLQLLLKTHNAKKGADNWKRFDLDEQINYLQTAINLQNQVAARMGIIVDNSILESLLERIRAVFGDGHIN